MISGLLLLLATHSAQAIEPATPQESEATETTEEAPAPDPMPTADEVLDSIAHVDWLRSLDTVRYRVQSEHWDPAQSFDGLHGAAKHYASSTATVVYDASGNLDLVMTPRPIWPTEWKWNTREIIAEGQYGWLADGPQEYGGPKKTALTPLRVGQRMKTHVMRSPDMLLRMLTQLDDPTVSAEGDLHVLTTTWRGAELRVLVDVDDGVLVGADVVEDLAIQGDVVFSTRYGNWAPIGGEGTFPRLITHLLDGVPVQQDLRTKIARDVEHTFEVPDKYRSEPDTAYYDRGHHRSVYYTSRIVKGFPIDTDEMTQSLRLEEVTDGVYWVEGRVYHSMLIDMGDSIVLCEPTLSPERTQATLELVAAEFPGKPVSHAINTHFHHDHMGGVRAAAAAGIQIVTSPDNAEAVAFFAGAPKTLVPDAQSEAQKAPKITTVADKLVLEGSSGRTVEVHSVPTRHAHEMLMVYVPDADALFISDLFNPGIPPARGVGGAIGRAVLTKILPLFMEIFRGWTWDYLQKAEELGIEPEYIVGGHGTMIGKHRDAVIVGRKGTPWPEAGDVW